ncbi:MAG: AAA family ATPase [Deltaproteobacteria bacterium]|jgi:ATP-dependent Lon protease|nr:AAA family ATPase [Deltaproteobacteria bacterium]MDA8306595.1 AAA family ATPase [Deltaproteobacteria bacterium]
MLPVELDRENLNDVPVSEHRSLNMAFQAIQAIVSQNVLSYFTNNRGVSLAQLVALRRSVVFRRLEDEANRTGLPTLLLRQKQGWNILIHERLIDRLARILSVRPQFPVAPAAGEERRVVKFCEFFLRHHFEHLIFPDASELDVIGSDIDFASVRAKRDPQAYATLLGMLENPEWGALGKNYAELLRRAQRGEECSFRIGRVAAAYAGQVAELPPGFLFDLFRDLDLEMKFRVLDKIYRKSLIPGQTVSKRTSELVKALRLFGVAALHDSDEALKLFTIFNDRRGIGPLFDELDISSLLDPEMPLPELFEIFKTHLEELVQPEDTVNIHGGWQAAPQPGTGPSPQHSRSLKERIDEARTAPDIPQSVIEVIEKNRMNATGQSGAKYTELIETLLAIPWGKIKKIWISPEEFEDGLDRSHYGLKKPKEIISDLFANLIWRYQRFKESERKSWHRTGSAILFAGPPGVGKTSLAISIARNLGIPYHKISLGGMKDEADIRGYGFTYEGSKPGLIVQGLIKMGVMNGMFIMDEADKTEKFAIATLLEILDPEQNHLFHDKYTQSTVDIDLSNCHFILTANTVETVPEAILNRCEVIFLDRYSVDEKIAIAREFLIERIRERYMIARDEIVFDPEEESEILRSLIRDYTSEAGVRDLERIMRTLFLRTHRKEIMVEGKNSVKLDMAKIRKYLDAPNRQRLINEDDRIGEMMALGVNLEMGIGTLIPIQATPVRVGPDRKSGGQSCLSMLHTTGNIERVMDESRKVASTAILHLSKELGIDSADMSIPVHLHFMGGSTKKDGPSAGAAIALALASLFSMRKIRRDVAATGEIDTQGRVTGIGGMAVKLETAYAAGSRTLIIPRENLTGNEGIDRLPDALKKELQILTFEQWEGSHEPFDYSRHMLQVVAVDDIVQASKVAFIEQEEIDSLDGFFEEHAEKALAESVSADFKTLRVIFVDNFGVAAPELPGAQLCSDDHECIILVRPDFREEISKKLGKSSGKGLIREFNPARERLLDVLQEIKTNYGNLSAQRFKISLIAPPPFLKKAGIRPEDLEQDAAFAGLRIFADCCTAGNVPVRDCSITLARSLSRLVDLSDELLEGCPFLSKSEGFYAPTVAFIPERYRIDVRRAQEILDHCLSKWLSIAGGKAENEALPARSAMKP